MLIITLITTQEEIDAVSPTETLQHQVEDFKIMDTGSWNAL